jgi:hypothetical protein
MVGAKPGHALRLISAALPDATKRAAAAAAAAPPLDLAEGRAAADLLLPVGELSQTVSGNGCKWDRP